MSARGGRRGAGEGPIGGRGDGPVAVEAGGSATAGRGRDAVTVVLPGQLRELAGGAARISVHEKADTVAELFQALRTDHPAIYDRIFTERREIRPHVNVFVDGADVRWTGGLETPVEEGSEVVVLPAVSGG